MASETQVPVSLPPSIKAALEQQALREARSEESVLESALSAYLRAAHAKEQAVSRAIEEADKGVFVSREAVDRWMASWAAKEDLPFPEPDVFLGPRSTRTLRG